MAPLSFLGLPLRFLFLHPVPDARKALSDDLEDEFPPFRRSHSARNSIRRRSMVYSSGSARGESSQTTSFSMSEPLARIFHTSPIITAKTRIVLAPGFTSLDVIDRRHWPLAPIVDALCVSTSARHSAAGKVVCLRVSRSLLPLSAHERMF